MPNALSRTGKVRTEALSPPLAVVVAVWVLPAVPKVPVVVVRTLIA